MVARRGKRGRDVALTPQAHDLLDEVDLAGEVGAVGGRGHRVGAILGRLHLAAQAPETLDHEVVRNVCAGKRTHASRAHGDHRCRHGCGVDVHDAWAHLSRAALLEEGRGDVGDVRAASAVDLALVADGGLAHEVKVAARARGVARREGRALEQDVGRGLVNLGVEATHNAGKRDGRLAAVGDDAHVGRERTLLLVKRSEKLALVRGTNHHVTLAVLALLELAQVEGMERLASEVHHIVGDVDHVVDGSGAGGNHAAREPLGAGANLHVAHHTGRVARAELRIIDAHVHQVVGVRALLLLDGRKRDVGALVEHGGGLHRHTHHGEAVRTVGRDLAVDHGV